MPFFGGSVASSRNQVMSKPSEGTMRNSAKSSQSFNTMKQRIQQALQRKDPVPASKEARAWSKWVHYLISMLMERGPVKTQLQNVETELSMSRVQCVCGDWTMCPAFFVERSQTIVCFHIILLKLCAPFSVGRWGGMKPCSVPYKPSKRSRFVTAIYNTNLGWMMMAIRSGRGSASWQVFVGEGVTLGMFVGMYPQVPSESKMKSRRNVPWWHDSPFRLSESLGVQNFEIHWHC